MSLGLAQGHRLLPIEEYGHVILVHPRSNREHSARERHQPPRATSCPDPMFGGDAFPVHKAPSHQRYWAIRHGSGYQPGGPGLAEFIPLTGTHCLIRTSDGGDSELVRSPRSPDLCALVSACPTTSTRSGSPCAGGFPGMIGLQLAGQHRARQWKQSPDPHRYRSADTERVP